LHVIAASHIADDARLRMAVAFPVEFGPSAIDLVLVRLGSAEWQEDSEKLLAIAKVNAPDRLLALAIEIVLGERRAPDWADLLLRDEAPTLRESTFERAWDALHVGQVRSLNAEILGPFASKYQTGRSVETWLQYCLRRRSDLSDGERDRGREIGYLLAHAPGDDLLGIIMDRGTDATYGDAGRNGRIAIDEGVKNGRKGFGRESLVTDPGAIQSPI
jgi:hypothetical protein